MKIKKIAIIAALIFAPLLAIADNPGEYWGYTWTARKLGTAWYISNYTYNLSDDLGSSSLTTLLGYYAGGLEGSFRNGAPNPTNFMLWALAFDNFTNHVQLLCSGSSDNPLATQLRPEITADILTLCSWPSAEAQNSELWDRIWMTVVAYDAPEEELTAWKDHFLKEGLDKTGAQVVKEATLSMFLNPYYLLRN